VSAENTKDGVTAWKLWRRNGLIWTALLCLLFLSLALAYVPMGLFTPTAGILIAFAKSALVLLLFMELASSRTLIRLAALSGVVFLIAMFALTLADVVSRLVGRELTSLRIAGDPRPLSPSRLAPAHLGTQGPAVR
jgi:cytochrome c oxidase subunit 4